MFLFARNMCLLHTHVKRYLFVEVTVVWHDFKTLEKRQLLFFNGIIDTRKNKQ